ncbi:Like-Sm (LSM) domain-containing protein [Cynara cardunculus var. scolymus]|uniref:Mechanosensitive ion channel protein n=1 Tax=Cynara cardunculus var. scolymus TaxID=59895 RepID=A0A118JVT5_CYNCS|nr:Like-Sm (LSM) domain-containing protein [Cynara cardunculus var. scolymus]
MDANGKSSKSGEISMTENRKSGEVVVTISGEEKDAKSRGGVTESPHRKSVDTPHENAYFMPSPNRPPKIPHPDTLTRRKTLARSIYSKPKSRFGEQPLIDSSMFDDIAEPVGQTSNSPIRIVSNRASPNNPKVAANPTASPSGTPSKETIRTVSITPKTPLMASPGGAGGVDEDEEIYKKVNIRKKLKYRRVRIKVLLEWLVLLILVGSIVASLTIKELKHYKVWSLELWKWCVLIAVIICGMLVTNWLMHFIVLLIELNFLLRKKVLYFVHGLKKCVQVSIWLIVVLVTWTSLFNDQDVQRSKKATRVLDYFTWTIVSLLVGSILWLLKTFLLKVLATSFHVSNFFDRIQESIFLQYVLLTLSGPPVMESLQNVGASASTSASHLSFQMKRKGGKEAKTKEVIDVSKLHQMKREKVSAWTMKMLVDLISNSGLSTFSGELEESAYDRGGGSTDKDKEINNEMEAIAAAYHIFRNVAQPGFTYIEDLDLRRFMIKEEVDIVFPMIDVTDEGHIDRKCLTEWVVYNGRKALAHALSDTKTAVKQLDKLVTAVLVVIVFVVWLLLTEIATTKVLVLLSSQLVVAAFIFGNTCKTIFEAIVFVFIMHPFDVGDRCVIDGVQLIVEEMNILTTVFLRFDNEKIYYPNSVLSTKPISNFYRSPDMGDNVEFSIDFATPFEKIGLLKDKLKKYLEKNPQLWHPNHNFVVKEIENVNKIKMVLFFNHTINFQDYGEKVRRRTELVLELKRIFEELKIKCNLLPQEVHLRPETTTK